jgi:hypothetical protein
MIGKKFQKYLFDFFTFKKGRKGISGKSFKIEAFAKK